MHQSCAKKVQVCSYTIIFIITITFKASKHVCNKTYTNTFESFCVDSDTDIKKDTKGRLYINIKCHRTHIFFQTNTSNSRAKKPALLYISKCNRKCMSGSQSVVHCHISPMQSISSYLPSHAPKLGTIIPETKKHQRLHWLLPPLLGAASSPLFFFHHFLGAGSFTLFYFPGAASSPFLSFPFPGEASSPLFPFLGRASPPFFPFPGAASSPLFFFLRSSLFVFLPLSRYHPGPAARDGC